MDRLDAWLTREQPEGYHDPHEPWEVSVDYDGYVLVEHSADPENSFWVYGKGPEARETADRAVAKMNARYPKAHCINEHGQCMICGDIVIDVIDGQRPVLVQGESGRWRVEMLYDPLVGAEPA